LKHLEPLQRVLEAYCRRSLRDGNEVADVLQAAVARAFRDFHEFEEGTNFRAWIFRYVSLEILNRNRVAGRMEPQGLLTEVPANPDAPDLTGDEGVAMLVLHCPERYIESCDSQVADAIWKMPLLERSILLLRAIAEFRYREIAEILDVPMGTVMGLLARGRARLRTQLADYARSEGIYLTREDDC
jgi:RNA polymerase sigma-70 factor (ECF subfamily)